MKKYIAFILVGLTSITLLSGCSSEEKKEDKKQKTEEKETTKKEDKKNSTSQKASDNWKDNQLQLKGKVITLPVSLKELKTMGFDFEDLEEFAVNPNQSVAGESIKDADGNTITGVYTNLSDKAVDIRETSLTAIIIRKDHRMQANKNLDIILPGEVQFGANIDEIKKNLGEPDSSSDSGKSTFVKYEDASQRRHYMEFELYDGKLINFTMYAQ